MIPIPVKEALTLHGCNVAVCAGHAGIVAAPEIISFSLQNA